MSYDSSNIFARILRGEIPCNKILENDHALAFHDVNPKAPIHVLVIPKGEYLNSVDFYNHGQDQEIVDFHRLLGQVIGILNLEENGYRLISNCGLDGGQEVPHFHVHILGGTRLGPLLAPKF